QLPGHLVRVVMDLDAQRLDEVLDVRFLGLEQDRGLRVLAEAILDLLEVREEPLLDLDDVEAERRLDDVAHLTDLEREGGFLERRHHLAAAEEAEVAT